MIVAIFAALLYYCFTVWRSGFFLLGGQTISRKDMPRTYWTLLILLTGVSIAGLALLPMIFENMGTL